MTKLIVPSDIAPLLPDLVQRLKRRESVRDSAKGVDRYFLMDYMGSAEFEWGALPGTLRGLREMTIVGPLIVGPLELHATREGQPVSCWYVGDETHKRAVEYWFQHCVATADGEYDFRMQENPRLHAAFGPEFSPHPLGGRRKAQRNYDRDYVGWWCVDLGYGHGGSRGSWAIFRDRKDADNWLLGLRSK